LVAVTSNSAKAQAFEKGKMYVNAQIGTNLGTNLIGTLDYAIADKISVGGGIWYTSINLGGFGSASGTAILGRGAYHFGEITNVDKLDLYGGAEIAVGLSGGSSTSFSIMPGARYFISERIGISSELALFLNNGGGSQFRIGAAFKF
jgi:hypothetical protein